MDKKEIKDYLKRVDDLEATEEEFNSLDRWEDESN